MLTIDELWHDNLLLRASPVMFGHAVHIEAIELSLIIILLRSWLHLAVVYHTIGCWWHSVIVVPVETVDHEWHVASSILLLRLRWQICKLHFNEPISILSFAVDPNGVRINLRGRALALRQELALNLDHGSAHNLATVNLLLLSECHSLAHGHLKL